MNFIVKRESKSKVARFIKLMNKFFENECIHGMKVEVVKFVLKCLPPFCNRIRKHNDRLEFLESLSDFVNGTSIFTKDAREIVKLAEENALNLELKENEKLSLEKFIKIFI